MIDLPIFRGKREDNNEWVMGYDIRVLHCCAVFFRDEKDPLGNWVEIQRDTFGQFTGVCTIPVKPVGFGDCKFCIFTGDILEITPVGNFAAKAFGTTTLRGVIEYDKKVAGYVCVCKDCTIRDWANIEMFNYKKIGNIYDNKKLLEENL